MILLKEVLGTVIYRVSIFRSGINVPGLLIPLGSNLRWVQFFFGGHTRQYSGLAYSWQACRTLSYGVPGIEPRLVLSVVLWLWPLRCCFEGNKEQGEDSWKVREWGLSFPHSGIRGLVHSPALRSAVHGGESGQMEDPPAGFSEILFSLEPLAEGRVSLVLSSNSGASCLWH